MAELSVIARSFARWTGRALFPSAATELDFEREASAASFCLLAADARAEPLLTYANSAALRLFGYTPAELGKLPASCTAPPDQRAARAEALGAAKQAGYTAGYSGLRVTQAGRLFQIRGAEIWSLCGPAGEYLGQAARFEREEVVFQSPHIAHVRVKVAAGCEAAFAAATMTNAANRCVPAAASSSNNPPEAPLPHSHHPTVTATASLFYLSLSPPPSRREPGCLRFQVLQDSTDLASFTLVEEYASPAAAAAHKTTAHYLAWRDAVAPMMAVPRAAALFIDLCPDVA